MTLLSTHTVYRGLLWSVGLLALTLVFGRVFCGWICPFGTLHHFFGWLLPSRKGRGALARRGEQDARLPAREVLPALRVPRSRRVGGSAIGGLFDPICIAVRVDRPRRHPRRAVPRRTAALGAAQDVHVARRPARRRPHAGLRSRRRSGRRKQFYFHQTWFIVFLLVAVLFVNRFIPRFWCRVLCPLGAFLGVFSRFALFGMEKDHAKCTDCNLCLVQLPGRRQPAGRREVAAGRVPHVHELRERLPRGRHQVHASCRTARAPIDAPDTERRTALAAAGAGAHVPPGGAHRRLARRQLPLEGHPPAGRGRGARVPRALHPLRRVHEGVPEQRAAPGVLRGGHRGALDADPHRAHRLLRVLVRALRPGVPDRRDPEDHREGEDGHRAAARQDRHGVLRPRPLPALVDADAVHRVRGVLPDVAEGDLGRGGRRPGPRQQARPRTASRPR